MDIKPFIAPENDINFWLDKHSLWFIMLGIVILVALLVFVLRRIYRNEDQPLTVVIPACLGMFLFLLYVGFSSSAYAEKGHAELDAYNAYMAEVENKLESEGFAIGSKKPHLRPGYESHITLTYENKDYACSVVSPTDTNAKVEFSCGAGKLNLDQIKETTN